MKPSLKKIMKLSLVMIASAICQHSIAQGIEGKSSGNGDGKELFAQSSNTSGLAFHERLLKAFQESEGRIPEVFTGYSSIGLDDNDYLINFPSYKQNDPNQGSGWNNIRDDRTKSKLVSRVMPSFKIKATKTSFGPLGDANGLDMNSLFLADYYNGSKKFTKINITSTGMTSELAHFGTSNRFAVVNPIEFRQYSPDIIVYIISVDKKKLACPDKNKPLFGNEICSIGYFWRTSVN